MRMICGIIVVLICAVGLAVYFRDPIPPGFSDPWRLQADLTMKNIVFATISILDHWGICSFARTIRRIDAAKYANHKTPDSLLVVEQEIDTIPVRLYRSKISKDTSKLPALVYYHGGGFFMGSLNQYHSFLVHLVEQMDIIVVSVDYRLAPEHTFPIPLDDCVKATKYVLTHGDKLGVDTARVAVGGDSAGGNLAAAVALKLRDEKFSPMPNSQLLIYPMLQGMDHLLPSMQQNANGPWLKTQMGAAACSLYAVGSLKHTSAILENQHTTADVKQYVYKNHISHDEIPSEHKYPPYEKPSLDSGSAPVWNDLKEIFENPYFAPLMASDFSGLPDTYVYTAQYDILRDEEILYVKKLRDAGVDVTHFHASKGFHPVCLYPEYIEGEECWEQFAVYLKDRL